MHFQPPENLRVQSIISQRLILFMQAAPSGTALSFIRKREWGSVLLNNYYIPDQACLPRMYRFHSNFESQLGEVGCACDDWSLLNSLLAKLVAHRGPMPTDDNYKAVHWIILNLIKAVPLKKRYENYGLGSVLILQCSTLAMQLSYLINKEWKKKLEFFNNLSNYLTF